MLRRVVAIERWPVERDRARADLDADDVGARSRHRDAHGVARIAFGPRRAIDGDPSVRAAQRQIGDPRPLDRVLTGDERAVQDRQRDGGVRRDEEAARMEEQLVRGGEARGGGERRPVAAPSRRGVAPRPAPPPPYVSPAARPLSARRAPNSREQRCSRSALAEEVEEVLVAARRARPATSRGCWRRSARPRRSRGRRSRRPARSHGPAGQRRAFGPSITRRIAAASEACSRMPSVASRSSRAIAASASRASTGLQNTGMRRKARTTSIAAAPRSPHRRGRGRLRRGRPRARCRAGAAQDQPSGRTPDDRASSGTAPARGRCCRRAGRGPLRPSAAAPPTPGGAHRLGWGARAPPRGRAAPGAARRARRRWTGALRRAGGTHGSAPAS